MGKQYRTGIVTGATRGIGREIARLLAAAGLDVIGTGSSEQSIERCAEQVPASLVRCDMADPDDIERFAKSAPQEIGVLVNNAGVTLRGFDRSVAERTLRINVEGVRELTDALLPKLGRDARIVMVSSGMGELSCLAPALRRELDRADLTKEDITRFGERFVRAVEAGTHEREGFPSSAYRVSKALLNALTRVYARELENDERRILVNAACPGWVRTDMGGSSAPRSPEEGARTPVWLALLPAGGPTGGFFRDKTRIPF